MGDFCFFMRQPLRNSFYKFHLSHFTFSSQGCEFNISRTIEVSILLTFAQRYARIFFDIEESKVNHSVKKQRIDNTIMEKLLGNPCLDVVTSKIISHLDYPSVVACSQVSQDFQSFVNNEKRVWINLVKSLQKHEKLNIVWTQICDSYQDFELDVETVKYFVGLIDSYLREGSEQFGDPIEYYGLKKEFDKVDDLVFMYNQVDPSSCFWLACAFGTLEIVEKIHTKDTKSNVATETGITALMASIINDKKDIAEFLLDNAKINQIARDASGKTAFMYACEFGRYEVAKMFIRGYGINVTAYEENEDIKNAFLLAKANGHLNIIGLLLEETNISKCTEPWFQNEIQQVSYIFQHFSSESFNSGSFNSLLMQNNKPIEY